MVLAALLSASRRLEAADEIAVAKFDAAEARLASASEIALFVFCAAADNASKNEAVLDELEADDKDAVIAAATLILASTLCETIVAKALAKLLAAVLA